MWDQTVEVLTYPTLTERGYTRPNLTATPAVTTITGCEVQPGVSTELTLEPREGTAVRWTLFVRGNQGLTDQSLVRYQGTVYQVDGQPATWVGPLANQVAFLVDWK